MSDLSRGVVSSIGPVWGSSKTPGAATGTVLAHTSVTGTLTGTLTGTGTGCETTTTARRRSKTFTYRFI
eukprot:1337145-Amorphochlora_amoeboformis.AAC.1